MDLNGYTGNALIVVLLGMFGLLWRQNNSVERLTGYVHENHAIAQRLEGHAAKTNGRLGEVEERQAEQRGAIRMVSIIGAIVVTMMTIGIGVAGLILAQI